MQLANQMICLLHAPPLLLHHLVLSPLRLHLQHHPHRLLSKPIRGHPSTQTEVWNSAAIKQCGQKETLTVRVTHLRLSLRGVNIIDSFIFLSASDMTRL
jgi:hypothetical protein